LTVRFVIPGDPRTKKNSGQIITLARRIWNPTLRRHEMKKFPKIMPSPQYLEWFKQAMQYMPVIRRAIESKGVCLPISGDIAIAATFYRSIDHASDLNGYMQALGDFLQSPVIRKEKQTRDGAGIIEDDSQIFSWDGTRQKIDRTNPRIEVVITAGETLFDQVGESQ
jgi:Holliday junction resolvase RusA-like endonuclease